MAEYMTAEGKKLLEEKLERLKVEGRAEIAEKIRVAREFGDLSENAEYDIAKEEQAKMEAEIIEIEGMLHNVVIIGQNTNREKIDVGNTVTILDIETGKEETYQIVGTHESNPVEQRISNESPVGKALLGKKKGDEFVIESRIGSRRYKIQAFK